MHLSILFLFGTVLGSFLFCIHFCNVQFKPESTSLAELAFDTVVSIMQEKNLLYNRQAKTRTLCFADVVGACLIVTFPHVRKLFRLYAGAVILNLQSVFAACLSDCETDILIFAAVFDGVACKI